MVNGNDEGKRSVKKNYTAPSLTDYGQLERQTQTGNGAYTAHDGATDSS